MSLAIDKDVSQDTKIVRLSIISVVLTALRGPKHLALHHEVVY